MRQLIYQTLLSILRRIGTVFAVVLVLFAAPFQGAIAAELNASDLKRPGQLVNIGNQLMHILCMGEGSPTIIMDVGLGGISLEWIPVQKVLAQQVKVCIYDRAGYGWSYPSKEARTSSHIADELFLLLNEAQIKPPYILVGHSFGGFNMQLFASRYQYLTAGLVLVDSSHAEQVERFLEPPIQVKLVPSIKGMNMITQLSRPKVHAKIPGELKGIVKQLLNKPAMRRAIADEFLNFRQSAKEVRDAGKLPDVPLVVLSRGKRVWPENHHGDLMEQLWFDLQEELAERSPNYIHYVAKKSGHHIHLDQPQLIVDAVRKVIITARQRQDRFKIAEENQTTFYVMEPLFENAMLYAARFKL